MYLNFCKFESMKVKNKLRNILVNKLQRLSAEKLTEVDYLLNTIENKIKSKEKTLKLAGIWKEIDEEIFNDLTEKLHQNRIDERQIQ